MFRNSFKHARRIPVADLRVLTSGLLAPSVAALLAAGCAVPPASPPCTPTVMNLSTEHLAEAVDLAWKSARANEPDSAILQACGIDVCTIVEGLTTGARAFVQRDTASRMQWVAFDSAELHGSVRAAVAELRPELAELLSEGHTTWFTGHGTGAALAAATGARFAGETPNLRVVTFGQPMVTGEGGAARADSGITLLRYTLAADAAVARPAAGLAAEGATHFGHEMPLDPRGCGLGAETTEVPLESYINLIEQRLAARVGGLVPPDAPDAEEVDGNIEADAATDAVQVPDTSR